MITECILEDRGLDMEHKAKCGVDDTEIRSRTVSAACWQKTSNEGEGGSQSQVACGTRLLRNGQGGEEWSIKRQRCQRQRTRETFRDLCDVESAALGRTQDEKSRLCEKSKKEQKETRILGPPDSSISIRKEGTTVQVCGEQRCGEVAQWDLCDGTKGQRTNG